MSCHESLRRITLSRAIKSLRLPRIGDDVLYRLGDCSFVEVHLTFKKELPERPDWPKHVAFETLADWMIGKMLADHVERFALPAG